MIEFTYNDKKYTLTFNRETAKMAEQKGFRLDEDSLEKMPLTQLDILYHFAFKAKQPTMSDKKINEIVPLLQGKKDLISELIKDFSQTYESLLGEPDEKNAIKWEIA